MEGESVSCDVDLPCLKKHVESNDTFYVDLAPALGNGETVSSVTSVTCTDTNLTASSAAVLTGATTVTETERDEDGNTTTRTYVIAANKGVSFTLTAGTVGAGCSVITVKFLKSTGKTDAVGLLIKVHGEDV